MTNILKFQPKGKKEWVGQISLTSHVQTDILDDGSVWFRVGTRGTQDLRDKEIIWDEWRKVDE